MNSFTGDLIAWIEDNLDKKMILDEVASRAGYSKWHLQRIFRRETGMTLATYIRKRKLSESAVLLRMTGIPVITAAERFGFSNQQAFTRTFTKYFTHPPQKYRHSQNWSFGPLQPSLLCEQDVVPVPERVHLSLPPLESITLGYQCPADSIRCASFHAEQFNLVWRKARNILHARSLSHVAEKFLPASNAQDVMIFQTFAYHGESEVRFRNGTLSESAEGLYLRFPFRGSISQLLKMKVNIYQYFLPEMAEVRRNASDLFMLSGNVNSPSGEPAFTGFYHIPVS